MSRCKVARSPCCGDSGTTSISVSRELTGLPGDVLGARWGHRLCPLGGTWPLVPPGLLAAVLSVQTVLLGSDDALLWAPWVWFLRIVCHTVGPALRCLLARPSRVSPCNPRVSTGLCLECLVRPPHCSIRGSPKGLRPCAELVWVSAFSPPQTLDGRLLLPAFPPPSPRCCEAHLPGPSRCPPLLPGASGL